LLTNDSLSNKIHRTYSVCANGLSFPLLPCDNHHYVSGAKPNDVTLGSESACSSKKGKKKNTQKQCPAKCGPSHHK